MLIGNHLNPTHMNDLEQIFFNDLKDKILQSKSLINSESFSALKKMFHTVKGGASFVKQERIRALATKGEEHCKEKNMDKVRETIAELEQLISRVS